MIHKYYSSLLPWKPVFTAHTMKYEAARVSDNPGDLAIVVHISSLFMARTFHVPDCINDSADTFNLRVYKTL